MTVKVTLHIKALATHITFKVLILTVHKHVCIKMGLHEEALRA